MERRVVHPVYCSTERCSIPVVLPPALFARHVVLMLLSSLLLGAALHASPADTSKLAESLATSTVARTPVTGVDFPLQADSIVVRKAKRTLTLYFEGLPLRTYAIALGTNPVGDKVQAGDGRTPEGVFRIDSRNPNSKYYMALHVSYPDSAHQARATALGVSPGGDIMIHGLPPKYASIGADHVKYNWTEGCIAVTDAQIQQIWSAVPDGTPIDIEP